MSHRDKSKLDKTQEHYWKLYHSWKSVFSPALENSVLFTRWGWDHLLVEKYRTKSEKIERLSLLPLAKKLLEISTTVQSKRFQNYHDHYQFTALMSGIKITVIVIEYKKKYYFYSVFKA